MKAASIPIRKYLKQIEARGVRLRVDGEVVRVGWPEKKQAPEIRQILVDRKPEILAVLCPVPDCLTDEGKKVYQEYVAEMLAPSRGPKLNLKAAQGLAMELVSCFPGNLRENIKE